MNVQVNPSFAVPGDFAGSHNEFSHKIISSYGGTLHFGFLSPYRKDMQPHCISFETAVKEGSCVTLGRRAITDLIFTIAELLDMDIVITGEAKCTINQEEKDE